MKCSASGTARSLAAPYYDGDGGGGGIPCPLVELIMANRQGKAADGLRVASPIQQVRRDQGTKGRCAADYTMMIGWVGWLTGLSLY